MGAKRKAVYCKICLGRHHARGFCELHLNMFYRGNLDETGVPIKGYSLNGAGHLRKIKCELRRQVIESSWFRDWRSKKVSEFDRTCQSCGDRYVKLHVHHDKRRSFASILAEAKSLYSELKDQEEYCKATHEAGGLLVWVLCRPCHAKFHEGDKCYNWLRRVRMSDQCSVCGKKSYCKGFCAYHYQQYRAGVWNLSGKRLRVLKQEREKTSCIACGKETLGYDGPSGKFCHLHYSRFGHGIIDINGNEIRNIRIIDPLRVCKVCGGKHYGKGFCLTHYNRFKIGQIDEEGKELRPLGEFVVKGMRRPVPSDQSQRRNGPVGLN